MALAGAACGNGEDSTASKTVTKTDETRSAKQLATALGCTGATALEYENSPIRGAAALSGVACSLGTAELHVFQRHPLGDSERKDIAPAWRDGGTVENIKRLVGAGNTTQGCSAFLLIGDEWFVTSSNRDALDDVRDKLGGEVEPIVQATTPASYVLPGCSS